MAWGLALGMGRPWPVGFRLIDFNGGDGDRECGDYADAADFALAVFEGPIVGLEVGTAFERYWWTDFDVVVVVADLERLAVDCDFGNVEGEVVATGCE